MEIVFTQDGSRAGGDVLVAGVLAGRTLPAASGTLDLACGGSLRRLAASGRFTGAEGQIAEAAAPGGLEAGRVLLLGLGDAAGLDAHAWERLGGAVAARLDGSGAASVRIVLDPPEEAALGGGRALAHLALGLALRSYRYDRYRTRPRDGDDGGVTGATVVSSHAEEAQALWRGDLGHIAQGVMLARDLFAEPANDLYPESLIERLGPLAEVDVDVEAFGPDKLSEWGMNAMLAVGRGSAHEPRLVVLRWNGAADAGAPPLAFVGKGVTFDSGGISIKPAKGMEEMKGDMAGAAAVAGAMRALAGRKAAVNAVGVLALAENMPSGRAYRPGDIVKTMAGWTVEVLNTDAEGRLVLADALWLAQQRFRPAAMVDLATLTYDIMKALGLVFTGMFATDDDLAADLAASSLASGERLWRMPLDKAFEDNLGSDVADLRHFGAEEEEADACHGAQFLSRFAGGVPWAHLDIAGKEIAYNARPLCPKGPTGVGVRLLDALARRRET